MMKQGWNKKTQMIDWLIDSNVMSTLLGFFMSRFRLIAFIVRFYLHFLYSCFFKGFLAHGYSYFKQIFLIELYGFKYSYKNSIPIKTNLFDA